ncbi:MAG: T9SS type A sorting domain-containing protein [Ignavibacteriaceae bacterium]
MCLYVFFLLCTSAYQLYGQTITWTETQPAGDANKSWSTSSISSDGTKLIAGIGFGRLYISANSGGSWTETRPDGNVNRNWFTTSMSSDGTKLIAGVYDGGKLYISANSGSSWTETQPAGNDYFAWRTTSMSSDGTNLIAGIEFGRLYISTNSGSSWTETQPAGNNEGNWYTTSMSSDGTKLIAGNYGGRLYISTNSGGNWTETQPAGNNDGSWYVSSMSSDGTKMIAGGYGRLYLSTNSGSSWTETQPAGNVSRNWRTTSMSSDGTMLIAGVSGARLYISTNSGGSWTETRPAGDANRNWITTSMNSDGTNLIAGATSGRLYLNNEPLPVELTSFTATANGSNVTLNWQTATDIEYCYSTGNVSTSGNNAGGFIGYFQNPSSFIRYCYSTGSVTCSGDRAGGFAGVLTSSSYINISNCYSLGNVTRSSGTETNFGGFIGYSGGTYTTINYCYSAGSVNFGTSYGFIGYHTNETANVYTSNFFDAQTSGQSSGIGATGKTTTEMKTQSTFTNAGWNFSTYWQMIGTNYPDLQGNSNPALPVELTSFSAQVQIPNVVTLTWATATEVNNYGFEVERTEWMNGCMNEWKQIGFVQGSGNSNAPKSYSFSDNTHPAGNVLYRLKQIDNDGTVSYSQIVEVEVNSLPTEFTLSQNYPNPFNPSTVISYQLPLNSLVTLELFAVTGEKVGTLINGEQEAGYYNFELNSAKFSLTSGIYFYRFRAGEFVSTKKLILLK